MKYFEDIQIGESSGVGSYTFTAEAIKSFAARFDPQPFHLDERRPPTHISSGCAPPAGTRCVSGCG
jgi:acyl dehydratase